LSTQRSLNPSERFPPGQPKPTELTTHARLKKPAVRQIEVDLVAEPPLGPDAHTVADHQHSDGQLRVNRGSSNPTAKRLQSLTETLELEMPVNAAQQMIARDMIVEAEVVKQLSRR
jgi:hypothetical protein